MQQNLLPSQAKQGSSLQGRYSISEPGIEKLFQWAWECQVTRAFIGIFRQDAQCWETDRGEDVKIDHLLRDLPWAFALLDLDFWLMQRFEGLLSRGLLPQNNQTGTAVLFFQVWCSELIGPHEISFPFSSISPSQPHFRSLQVILNHLSCVLSFFLPDTADSFWTLLRLSSYTIFQRMWYIASLKMTYSYISWLWPKDWNSLAFRICMRCNRHPSPLWDLSCIYIHCEEWAHLQVAVLDRQSQQVSIVSLHMSLFLCKNESYW